jgi:thiol-disulfide isomerase/thioredoxin
MKHNSRRALYGVAAAGICLTLASLIRPNQTFVANAQGGLENAPSANNSDNSNAAPEFPTGATWLNTDKPLALRALRGKVVLLDFWTYGCINCIHILPDLKKLERKYPNELVVVGVHSAKFRNEDESGNIRNAMLRYNIEHPVLVDKEMQVWQNFGVNAWPSFVLIDPAGNVIDKTAGEGNYNRLDAAIGRTVAQFKKAGKLNTTPIKFALDAAKVADTPLWYPGKVVADEKSKRLFIADSNHNRIVITDFAGHVEAVAGSGMAGLKDGAFDAAQFQNPQGMALSGDTLYVADTNSHTIRTLDLKKGTVSTIAGTGKQAPWRSSGGIGISAALASPWDVLVRGNTLYIAMAGPHQLWQMDLPSQRVSVFAGSGREAKTDGPLQSAALAQPSGLATDGARLFFADSESSSVRAADLPGQGTATVSTLAGGGSDPNNLFQFGDVNGTGDSVRLQHPLAVVYREGKLYIADTYNHKIKVLDVASGQITTLAGSNRGKSDGTFATAKFYEPGGLALSGDKLFVADTNNHAIRILDLKARIVSTLGLKDVPKPLPAEPARPMKNIGDDTITLATVTVAPSTRGELVLNAKLPPDHKLSPDTPQSFFARTEGSGIKLSAQSVPASKFTLPLRVPFQSGTSGKGAVVVSSTVYYCTEKGGFCKTRSLRFRAPFEVAAGGSRMVTLPAQLK